MIKRFMIKIYFVHAFVALLSFISFSQERIKVNTYFYHTWLQMDFHKGIINGKTPCELNSYIDHFMQVYLCTNSDKVFMGNFNEGVKYSFKIRSTDTLEVINSRNDEGVCILYLSKVENKPVLIIEDRGKKIFFISLEEKYHVPHGVEHFINDNFFAGKYFAVEDSARIIFTTEGGISGINNFNEYNVIVDRNFLPWHFDTVLLLEIEANGNKKVRNSTLYHWKKFKDKIILYNISKQNDETDINLKYVNSKILNKYLTLEKIN